MISIKGEQIIFSNKSLAFQIHIPTAFCILSIITILLLYSRIVFYPTFYFQDPDYLNAEILHRPLGLKTFFALFKEPVAHNIQPVTASIFLLVNNLFGGDIFYFRIISLFLFFISSNLLFRLIFKVSGTYFISFWASLLFIIHPLNVEIVAWISSMKYLVALPLILFGLLNYIQYSTSKASKHAKLYLASGILALLSNPASVIFPALTFSYDYVEGKSAFLRLIKEKLVHLLLSLFIIWSSIHVLSPNIRMAFIENYFLLRPLAFFAGVGRLLTNLLSPFNLSPFYRFGIAEKDSFLLLLAVPFTIILMILILNKKIRVSTRWGVALVLLGFGINYFQISTGYLADRYLLFPAIGIILIITSSVLHLKFRTVILCAYAIFLSANSVKYIKVWRSDQSLIDYALLKQPETGYLIHLTRGFYFKEKGDYKKTIDHYLESMVLHFQMDNEQYGNSSFFTAANISTFEELIQVLSLSSEDQTIKVLHVIDKHAPKDEKFYCYKLKLFQIKNDTPNIEQTISSFNEKYPEREICQFISEN